MPSKVELKEQVETECKELREALFTIYDSQSVLAGGEETHLLPELSLLEKTIDSLTKRGILHPLDKEKILPEYLNAVKGKDGYKAHFWSRMIYREIVDILAERCKCETANAK